MERQIRNSVTKIRIDNDKAGFFYLKHYFDFAVRPRHKEDKAPGMGQIGKVGLMNR